MSQSNLYIVIKNVGKSPEYLKVYDDNGVKRRARFSNYYDAAECVRVIDMLRNDTAYQGADIVDR